MGGRRGRWDGARERGGVEGEEEAVLEETGLQGQLEGSVDTDTSGLLADWLDKWQVGTAASSDTLLISGSG